MQAKPPHVLKGAAAAAALSATGVLGPSRAP